MPEAADTTRGGMGAAAMSRMLPWLRLATLGGSLAVIAGLLGHFHWRLELATHWLLQLAAAGLVFAVLLALARSWRWAALAAVMVGLAAVRVLPVTATSAGDPPSPELTIFYANVLRSNSQFSAIQAQLVASDPDVIFLTEVSEQWLAELAPALTDYPSRLEEGRSDGYFGFALYSRLPVESIERLQLGPPIDVDIPTVAARIVVDGTAVRLFGMHTAPPAAPRYADHRDLELADLAQRIAAEDGPAVVVGDLNTTPLARGFQHLLADAGLRDAREGRGWLGTWPAGWPDALRIPIDHVLISEDVAVSSFTVLPPAGSDHRALQVELAL